MILKLAEEHMRGKYDSAFVAYDRVAGKAVDRDYEAIRRERSVKWIIEAQKPRVKKLVWC